VKFLGFSLLALIALFAIGSFLAPFAAIIYALFTFSLSEIIKGALILYVAMIPVSMILDAKKRVDHG
jgi:hypothetical protein